MASAATKAPTTELGNVSAWVQLQGWPYDPGEETAALTWPESVRTYSRMRNNSTVHSVLTAVTHPLRRPGIFKLAPMGARPEIVAQLAEDLDLPIVGQERAPVPRRRGWFSWLEHVRLALLKLPYGHMGFELVCDPIALEATGKARLWKLAPRFPHSISHIDTDAHGDLAGIRQWTTVTTGASGPEVPIGIDRLVWYANEREGAVWQGRSMLRPCYGDWVPLDRLLRVRAMLMERQGMGIPVGIAPEGADQDVINYMGDIASKARAGDFSGVGLPHGAELHFEGVRGTLPDIGAAIADHKAALADAVMASFMRLGTSDSSGNRALGQTFVDQFTQSEDTIAGNLADVGTQDIVERLVDLNWGPEEPAPAIVAKPIDAETHIDPLQLFRLVQVGAIQPDASLDDFLRQANQLPKRSTPWVSPATGALAPPVTDPNVAASRRRGRVVRQSYDSTLAAKSAVATWRDRVAEVLSTGVDAAAIAKAVAEGTDPAAAVAAGMSTDTAAMAKLLIELWGDGYGEGQTQAAEKAPATAAARRPTVVMASLADMVARAAEIAGGILGSLADRLAAALGDDEGATETTLAELLAAAAGDTAAAERIAATEYHRSVVSGAVDTWAGMGITETRWVRTSGSGDSDECQDLDGTTSGDWSDLPPLHPNCECLLEPA